MGIVLERPSACSDLSTLNKVRGRMKQFKELWNSKPTSGRFIFKHNFLLWRRKKTTFTIESLFRSLPLKQQTVISFGVNFIPPTWTYGIIKKTNAMSLTNAQFIALKTFQAMMQGGGSQTKQHSPCVEEPGTEDQIWKQLQHRRPTGECQGSAGRNPDQTACNTVNYLGTKRKESRRIQNNTGSNWIRNVPISTTWLKMSH